MRRLKNRLIKLVVLSSLMSLLASCSPGPQETVFRGATMGTSWSVKLVTDQAFDDLQLHGDIQELLNRVNSKMSNWDASSDVSWFNAQRAGCYPVSEETAAVVAVSQQISRLSEGVFDATAGPLIELWGFAENFTEDQIPDQASIELLIERVGYQKLQLNGLSLCKETDDLVLNLSATAKGYAVDLVAEYLQRANIDRYLVEVGGELRVSGQNINDRAWRIGIESPAELWAAGEQSVQQGVQKVLELETGALATSGDYRNYFVRDGMRYSHVINPRTGQPIPQRLASVTVVHPSTLWADGWATALLALGPERGMELAEQQQIAAYMILRNEDGFEAVTSSHW